MASHCLEGRHSSRPRARELLRAPGRCGASRATLGARESGGRYVVETQEVRLVDSKDLFFVEMQDLRCVEGWTFELFRGSTKKTTECAGRRPPAILGGGGRRPPPLY